MKSMSVLFMVLFFNVSLQILSAVGIFVRGTDNIDIALIGTGTFLTILGASVISKVASYLSGGVNPLSITFFTFYTGLWTPGILLMTKDIPLSWLQGLLIAVGFVLAFIGAIQISTGGWQSYE